MSALAGTSELLNVPILKVLSIYSNWINLDDDDDDDDDEDEKPAAEAQKEPAKKPQETAAADGKIPLIV